MSLQIKFTLILTLLVTTILLGVDIVSQAFNLSYSIGILLDIFLISAVLYILFRQMVASPLDKIIAAFRVFTSGQKNTVPGGLTIKTSDEFEETALLFNKLVTIIEEKKEQLKGVVAKLSSSYSEVSNYLEEITIANSGFSGAAEEISGVTAKQADNLKDVAEAVARMMESMKQVADTIIGLAGASEQVSKTSRISKVFAQEMLDKINETSTVITESAIRVQVLSERSQQISEIVKVINSIADQTNLLALNAAIEAARAGDAGKGFAVVAEEVRKLADESASSTVKIKGLIKEIQAETSQAMIITDKGSKEIFEGEAIVDKVKGALDDIGTQIQQVATKIGDISQLAQQQSEETNKLSGCVEKITVSSYDSKGDIHQALSSCQEQSASIRELTVIIQELGQISNELKQVVSPEPPPEEPPAETTISEEDQPV
ncbi:MAG: methyl-accepting chemotaxis protein [Candidatus Omnitrophota bacterium]